MLLASVLPGGLGAFALIVAAIVVALILLLVWLLSRDRDVTQTSFGFYVKRERFSDEPSGLDVRDDDADTQQWPRTPS